MDILYIFGFFSFIYLLFGGSSKEDDYLDYYDDDKYEDEDLNNDELSFSKDYILDDEIDFNTW